MPFGITLENFPGLDFSTPPNEQSGAIDSLNILHDRGLGRIKPRWGYEVVTSVSGANSLATFKQGNQSFAFVGSTSSTTVSLIDLSINSLVSSLPTGHAGINAFAPVGTPTSSRLYFATTEVGKVQNGVISLVFSGAGSGARFVSPTTYGGLAYADLSTSGEHDRVAFSTPPIPGSPGPPPVAAIPGDPETVDPNNYVDVSPGDGEVISGMVLFREQHIVFKQTKYFVFYGISVDATNNPVFNYRTVNTGIGQALCPDGSPQAPCVGADGVYFTDGRSVYRTTGGEPTRISDPIDPYLQGVATPFFSRSALTTGVASGIRLRWINNRLFVIMTSASGTNWGMFVYDPRNGSWAFWDVPVSDLAPGRVDHGDEEMYGVIPATGQLIRFKPVLTTDAGSPIPTIYRSAFVPLDYRGRTFKSGSQNVEKTVRESMVEGTGSLNYRLTHQWQQPGSLPAGQALTLGTGTQVLQKRDRRAVRGRMFSWQVDSTSPWSVERIIWNLRNFQAVGVQNADGA